VKSLPLSKRVGDLRGASAYWCERGVAIGDWMYNAALLGYVFSVKVGRLGSRRTVCRLLPYVLLSPIGGVIADRLPIGWCC